MTDKHSTFQLIWGLALVIAGVGVFFRIPQVIPQLKQIATFGAIIYFIYFCFYLIGILLIGGGLKKIFAYFKADRR